jgi:hypothetical protein
MKYSHGSNELPASSSFHERVEYAKNYPRGYSEHNSVDYWYDNMFFGRIDQNQDAIYPAAGSVKRLDGKDEVFAINFVADAFNSMRATVGDLMRVGTIPSTGFGILNAGLSASRGWRSPREDYFSFMRELYSDNFFPFLIDPDINEDILNFSDFVEQFTLFVGRYTLLRPYTMTEYITSNLGTPLYSGWAIEIVDSFDHGEDIPKIASYMNDPHFEIYRQIAANNGFNLDKNAPWRLVAIPYAEQISTKMANNEVNLETMVDKLYKRSYLSDIPDLKFYLKEIYNNFVKRKPTVHIPLIKGENRKRSLTRVVKRDIMTDEQYREEWESDNAFWVRLYIYVRAKETNRDWNQYKFDQVSQKAAQFFKYSGKDAAYKFINKEVRRPWGEDKVIGRYRRGNFRFQRK